MHRRECGDAWPVAAPQRSASADPLSCQHPCAPVSARLSSVPSPPSPCTGRSCVMQCNAVQCSAAVIRCGVCSALLGSALTQRAVPAAADCDPIVARLGVTLVAGTVSVAWTGRRSGALHGCYAGLGFGGYPGGARFGEASVRSASAASASGSGSGRSAVAAVATMG